MSAAIGLTRPLTEHSARRGGVGYFHYVLKWDLATLYREFKWESVAELMSYLGITDRHNAYFLAGFTAQSTLVGAIGRVRE